MQATIARMAEFRGQGLHSGAAVRMAIRPAPRGHGIRFQRSDLPHRPVVPALWDQVVPSKLCTLLDGGNGAEVSTIEHVMAALAGTGIHNALVEIDGPEVPILDGSARPFVEGIRRAGIRRQPGPLSAIRVLKDIIVHDGEAWASLAPADRLEIDFRIDFADGAIGRQQRRLDLVNGAFVEELADSRTFCRQADVAVMQQKGLALGGTYFNAVVVDGDRVLTPGGLRHADEPVRHKMLDAVGDLALAGAPLLARYTGNRAGHALTNRLLRAMFAQPDAWERVTLDPAARADLPGLNMAADPVGLPANHPLHPPARPHFATA